MLPQAHLTSHSGMCGSRWVITPSWLSGLWTSFLYSSSVYSYHLFLISSASISPYHFCPLLSPSLHEMFPWYFWFSWRDLYSLSHSIVFLCFFALIAEEGFLISSCYSLGLCSQMLVSFLFSLAFTSLLFTAICKASSDSHFAFLHFLSMALYDIKN